MLCMTFIFLRLITYVRYLGYDVWLPKIRSTVHLDIEMPAKDIQDIEDWLEWLMSLEHFAYMPDHGYGNFKLLLRSARTPGKLCDMYRQNLGNTQYLGKYICI
ncbi:hypothetical protein ABW19_dt0206699 [Dactylella cylindrospora]|nr:hypothetical protein ABW19_dt0206699 [Dactylella cylindrospora]